MRRILFPIAGVLLTVFVILTVEPQDLPGGYKHRMLALEFATTPETIKTLVPDDSTRKLLRGNLYGDTAVAVPLYWVFFISMAAFMYAAETQERQQRKNAEIPIPGKKQEEEKQHPLDLLWIVAVPLAISIAAVADVVENFASLSALDSKPGVGAIHVAAYIKWGGIGVSCLLLGVGLIGKKLRTFPAAFAYLAVGVVMAWVLATNTAHVDIPFAMLGIAVALTGEATAVLPRKLASQ